VRCIFAINSIEKFGGRSYRCYPARCECYARFSEGKCRIDRPCNPAFPPPGTCHAKRRSAADPAGDLSAVPRKKRSTWSHVFASAQDAESRK